MKKTYQIDKQRAVQQFRKQAGTSNEQISSHSRCPTWWHWCNVA